MNDILQAFTVNEDKVKALLNSDEAELRKLITKAK